MTKSSRFWVLPPAARIYIAVIVLAGALTVTESAYTLYLHPVGWDWAILALLTLVSGSATVRLPAVPATISISETFVFTSTLLFGPAAGTLTVALDALVISAWSYRRHQPLLKLVFNVCAVPLTLWLSAHLFFQLAQIPPLAQVDHTVPLSKWVIPLLAFTLTYFLVNSWIVTIAIALERRLPAFHLWRHNIAWLSVNYFGGASVAALLVSYRNSVDFTYVTLTIPLLIILYVTYSVSMGRVNDANKHLAQLNGLYMSTIETLAMAIDAKDQITHGHIRRVQRYAVGLARALGVTDPSHIKAVEAAALLHDMGKLAVPEYILNKPGPLTPAEFEKMKLHASVGSEILSSIDFPYPVVPIVRHHHECWDGSGYPDGLRGTGIPLGARILSVADCFDALTSDRPYRPRLSDREALRILTERRGTMYDPLVVDTFCRVHAELATTMAATPAQSFTAITDAATSPRAVPITRTQPLDDIAASSEEMLTLFTLARELTGRLSVTDIVDVVLKHLRRMVPSSLSVLYLYEEDGGDLVASCVSGDNPEIAQSVRVPLGQRLSGWVGANRQSIRNSDPILDFGELARTMSPRLRSCLSTPMIVGDKLVGVLSLYSQGVNAFSEDHQRLVEIVARQVSPVLQRSVDYAASSVRAFRDPLTGLPNLHHLRQLADEQNQLAELPTPTSLIYIDINQVQAVSATHGRRIGDHALRQIVQQLRANLRAADVLFRLSGDEFAVLLLQTDRETASYIALRMQTSVQQISAGGAAQRINARLTVVSAPDDGSRIDTLADSARRRLMHHSPPAAADSSSSSDAIH